jgi:hypothetical protein
LLHILGDTTRTRLFVGVGRRRPVKDASRSARKAIARGKKGGEFRKAKHPCPVCKFKWVIVCKRSKAMLCLRCHLICPARLRSAKTLKLVQF